ncbi:MotA/TolQ/ExbB proton channel family protein [Thalassotalea piscium]
MMELLEKGGFMMYPILFSSIIALGVIIERFYVVFVDTPLPEKHKVNQVFELSKAGKINEASQIMNQDNSALINMLAAILNESDETHQEKAAILAGNEIIFHLRTRLSILSAIGSAAPLMGLLGTVFGMINVFSDVSAMQGGTDPTILASGIWTALLTTAAGMSVAIPCVLIYHYLDRKIKNIAHTMEYDGNKLIAILNHLPHPRPDGGQIVK